MPCDDVTEILRIRLDAADRLAGYKLRKRTCGRAVGEENLLETEFSGRPATDLLAVDTDQFADGHDTGDEMMLFLHLKHFFAVRAGLRALLGLQPAGVRDPVRVARVYTEGDGVVLEAEIPVDILTAEISACGRCKGCGSIALRLAGD